MKFSFSQIFILIGIFFVLFRLNPKFFSSIIQKLKKF